MFFLKNKKLIKQENQNTNRALKQLESDWLKRKNCSNRLEYKLERKETKTNFL